MDHSFKSILVHAAVRSGMVTFARSWEGQRVNLLRVLAYHRIGNIETESGLLDPALLSASPELFEQQMRFLVDNYRLISLVELLQAIETHDPLPPQSVLVTFDDGYHDFLDVAWPILKHYHVPTILFLPTGPLLSANNLFWWDRLFQGIFKTCSLRLNLPATGDLPLGTRQQRLEAFARLKSHIRSLDYYAAMSLVDTVLQELNVIPQTSGLMLSWSDARFLNEDGCYLGTHTRQHSCLSRMPINDARQDIRAGKLDQTAEIGTTWPIFSYPYGESCDLCDHLDPILQEEGVKLAVTTVPGINDWSQIDLLRIKRICPSSYHTMAEFQFSLTKIFNFYTALRGHSFRFPGKNGHSIYLPH